MIINNVSAEQGLNKEQRKRSVILRNVLRLYTNASDQKVARPRNTKKIASQNILVYPKSPRRRRERNLIVKS